MGEKVNVYEVKWVVEEEIEGRTVEDALQSFVERLRHGWLQPLPQDVEIVKVGETTWEDYKPREG